MKPRIPTRREIPPDQYVDLIWIQDSLVLPPVKDLRRILERFKGRFVWAIFQTSLNLPRTYVYLGETTQEDILNGTISLTRWQHDRFVDPQGTWKGFVITHTPPHPWEFYENQFKPAKMIRKFHGELYGIKVVNWEKLQQTVNQSTLDFDVYLVYSVYEVTSDYIGSQLFAVQLWSEFLFDHYNWLLKALDIGRKDVGRETTALYVKTISKNQPLGLRLFWWL